MHPSTPARPITVTVAAVLHWLIAAAFLSIPALGLIYGADVQTAAEAEVVRQGLPPSVLSDNQISFRETGVAIAVPVVVALALVALGLAVRSGKRPARIVAWIVMPLVLLGNIAIIASNATAVRGLQDLFAASGDANLRRLDAQGLFDAAMSAYPGWLPALTTTRNVIVIGGASLIIVLLALRSARPHFRRADAVRLQEA